MRQDPESNTHRARFDSTHWSVILAAAQTQSPEAEQALEELCHCYWHPLYCYLRRKGHGPEQAEDLTQQFFADRVVTKRIFQGLQPRGGKFRSWLLCSLENMVRNAWDKEQAQKRGGGQVHFSLDFEAAELRYLQDDELSAEQLYDRSWAFALLDRALVRMQSKYAKATKSALFDELKQFLPGNQEIPNRAGVASRLGMDEKTLKTAISRFRAEWRNCVRAEINRTVASPEQVDEELRYLVEVLNR